LAFWTLHALLKVDYLKIHREACVEQEGTLKSVANTEVSYEKTEQGRPLDPAAVCRSSDPMAVRELPTRIDDKWTIFLGRRKGTCTVSTADLQMSHPESWDAYI
jgi:hypothetical protein